jgi:hypothetical protein
MEAFDQRESTRTNHKSRSGNPEFEIEFTIESREISGKSEEEEVQEREETPIPLTVRTPHGRAVESPGANFGGGSGDLSG